MSVREIFDRSGAVVGWLDRENVFDRASRSWVAFVREDVVFAIDGAALGIFRFGFFRDRRGGAVAFIRGASRGPELPESLEIVAPPRMPSWLHDPRTLFRPPMPVGGTRWGLDWRTFLAGGREIADNLQPSKAA